MNSPAGKSMCLCAALVSLQAFLYSKSAALLTCSLQTPGTKRLSAEGSHCMELHSLGTLSASLQELSRLLPLKEGCMKPACTQMIMTSNVSANIADAN